MFCPQCGAETETPTTKGNNFCHNCGTELSIPVRATERRSVGFRNNIQSTVGPGRAFVQCIHDAVEKAVKEAFPFGLKRNPAYWWGPWVGEDWKPRFRFLTGVSWYYLWLVTMTFLIALLLDPEWPEATFNLYMSIIVGCLALFVLMAPRIRYFSMILFRELFGRDLMDEKPWNLRRGAATIVVGLIYGSFIAFAIRTAYAEASTIFWILMLFSVLLIFLAALLGGAPG